MSEDREVVVGETATDGSEVTLPVVELLTGRGFVTGKSGSGKSNTASVIAEELLDAGFPLLIVDTDGEYYGLKEEYEMLHAGADEECDIQIGPEHAEQMATLALEENVPIILDVSGYLDEDVADELLRETAQQLFVKEKKLKKPFLLVVEEVHEYIPEGGGVDETGRLLIKIGKRGRKHGLGILGISQRPADVKKDFITQANWLVWHRLTWDNDTNVVGRIIDSEYAERVSGLGDGEAFVQTDWTDHDVRRVQFRRKRTFDAGATPGLDDFERPELKSVSDALVGELQDISERKDRERDRIHELENELEKKEKRIETLEDELDSARDVSNAAEQMADALSGQGPVQTQLPEMGEEFRRLHEELVELEREREELRAALAERDEQLAERDDRIAGLEARLEKRRERAETLEARVEALQEYVAELVADEGDESTSIVHADGDPLEFGYVDREGESSDILVANADRGPGSIEDGAGERPSEGRSTRGAETNGRGDREADDPDGASTDESPKVTSTDDSRETASTDDSRETTLVADPLETTPIDDRLAAAADGSRCDVETAREVVAALADGGPSTTEALAAAVDRSSVAVQSLFSELRVRGVLDRNEDGTYELEAGSLATLERTDSGE